MKISEGLGQNPIFQLHFLTRLKLSPFHQGSLKLIAMKYRVRSPVWAKSLTPGFALMNHLFEMINSVRIDCCAET